MVGIVGLAAVIAIDERAHFAPAAFILSAVVLGAQLVGLVQPGGQVFEDQSKRQIQMHVAQRIRTDDQVGTSTRVDQAVCDLSPGLVQVVLVIAEACDDCAAGWVQT